MCYFAGVLIYSRYLVEPEFNYIGLSYGLLRGLASLEGYFSVEFCLEVSVVD